MCACLHIADENRWLSLLAVVLPLYVARSRTIERHNGTIHAGAPGTLLPWLLVQFHICLHLHAEVGGLDVSTCLFVHMPVPTSHYWFVVPL